MSKRTKKLIAVLGLFLLSIGAYFGSEVWAKKKSETSSKPASATVKLGNLESSELVKIEVSGLVLEKTGEAWELKSIDGEGPPPGIEPDQNEIQSLTYSLASIWIENTVDEDPMDLSVYGLDKPSARTLVADQAGTQVEYLLGNMTPSRTSYYVMEKGDPKVYSISSYAAGSMNASLDALRDRTLFPAFQATELMRLDIESNGRLIEVIMKPETVPPYLRSMYTSHLLTSPYKLTRGVSSEALNKLVEPLSYLRVSDFIDDNPSSLSSFGLDKPARISIQTRNDSVELLIGNEVDGKRYAKLGVAPDGKPGKIRGVFTLREMDSVLNFKPFDLLDKFVLLVSIDLVDNFEIRRGEEVIDAEILRHADGGVGEYYRLYGNVAKEKSFKDFYQSLVALMTDAEYPRGAVLPPAQNSDKSIIIEYRLNSPPDGRLAVKLIPFNRDFYALQQEGAVEFLVSREQVAKIFTRAEEMEYE